MGAWRAAWGANLTFHAVQLPSLNMTEYTWIYLDWQTALGEMRLSQAATMADTAGTTVAVTLDLADLSSPFGSVHNRQKQEVGRRLALNALATAYGRSVNTGPTLESVTQVASSGVVVTVNTKTGDGGFFNGSHDCIQCCEQSPFELSIDGSVWTRVTAHTLKIRSRERRADHAGRGRISASEVAAVRPGCFGAVSVLWRGQAAPGTVQGGRCNVTNFKMLNCK